MAWPILLPVRWSPDIFYQRNIGFLYCPPNCLVRTSWRKYRGVDNIGSVCYNGLVRTSVHEPVGSPAVPTE